MKKLVLAILFLFPGLAFISAQKSDLRIRKGDKGNYLEHKVVPKESFFSVGRKYNVHPHALADYNKLDISKGLFIDQQLRIPLTDTNFVQEGYSGAPVYYVTGKNEGLLSVSKTCSDVKLARLREWNKLSSDQLRPGTKLIIGFLQGSEWPSVTLAPGNVPADPVVVKSEEKKDDNVVTKEEKNDPVDEKKDIVIAEKTDVKKEEKKDEKKTDPVTVPTDPSPGLREFGYFRKHFEQQVKSAPPATDETVTSGIFKTTSGWQDAKYYLLIDKVEPGTIVKVINPTNNKAIYAKVLGQMSGIRQNQGLDIRISNAAASMLEITELDKFIVKVRY